MYNVIDHVAVGATSLEAGGLALKDTLGVELAPGGKHPDMGTLSELDCVGVTHWQGIRRAVVPLSVVLSAPG